MANRNSLKKKVKIETVLMYPAHPKGTLTYFIQQLLPQPAFPLGFKYTEDDTVPPAPLRRWHMIT